VWRAHEPCRRADHDLLNDILAEKLGADGFGNQRRDICW
jgi:hypothetical protein